MFNHVRSFAHLCVVTVLLTIITTIVCVPSAISQQTNTKSSIPLISCFGKDITQYERILGKPKIVEPHAATAHGPAFELRYYKSNVPGITRIIIFQTVGKTPNPIYVHFTGKQAATSDTAALSKLGISSKDYRIEKKIGTYYAGNKWWAEWGHPLPESGEVSLLKIEITP